jgi:SulP family sulfate permease
MQSPLNITRFRPRLLDALEGYDRTRFFKDLGAGATVGIVALPLAMAFAIASGLKPEAGIWTAIIAGFLISLLGGSAVQIGGPAGAFIVIVYGIVERYGVANLLISTACAGVLLFAAGLFGLGRLVRFVPLSIVVGFTNGIAVLILLSQLKDLLGLTVEKMPADVFSQLHAMALQIGTFNPYAFALGLACVLGLAVWPMLLRNESKVGHAVQRLAGRMAR